MRLLQQQHLPHGCLTSKTILVEGPNHFRVVDRIASPVSDNLDVIYHKRSIKNIYLSPEQCDLIDQDRIGKHQNYRRTGSE